MRYCELTDTCIAVLPLRELISYLVRFLLSLCSLVGNEEGTFPTQKAIGEGEGSIELSEERRLCYVAMTRAKTHLVLTWRREVSYFAGNSIKTKDADRSRFLNILVSKGAQILSAAIRDQDKPMVSDHFPVTARVVFP